MTKNEQSALKQLVVGFGANYYHNMGGTKRTYLDHIVPPDDDDDVLSDDLDGTVEQEGKDGEEKVDIDDKDLAQLEDKLLKKDETSSEGRKEETDDGEADNTDDQPATSAETDKSSKTKSDNGGPDDTATATTSTSPKIRARVFDGMQAWEKEKDPILEIACSSASTLLLTEAGKIHAMGTVHGAIRPSPTRTIVQLPLKCVQIAAGRHFCLARMEGGLAVCSWGAGHFGQLGQGEAAPICEHPTVMEGLLPHHVGSPIASIAAGYWHGMAITQQGHAWAWGCNRNYQCGRKRHGDAGSTSSPSSASSTTPPTLLIPQLISFDHIKNANGGSGGVRLTKIACGRSHSVGLDEKGSVYCWGACSYGQCSGPSDMSLSSLRRKSGLVPPRQVEALSKVCIVDIAAGDTHTLALTGGGRVFAWGGSSEGQLGLGHSNMMNVKPKLISDLDFVAIEAGQERKRQSARLQEQNRQPQQGADSSTPTDDTVTATSSADLDESPTKTPQAESLSSTTAATPTPAKRVSQQQHILSLVPKVVSIYAAGSYSAALSSSGHLYTWGCNDVGNLGLPVVRPSHAENGNESSAEVPLPLLEPGEPVSRNSLPSASSSLRHFHTQSFDSSHNVGLPQRVDCLSNHYITNCAVSSTFLWCVGYPRDETLSQTIPKTAAANKYAVTARVGRTLYELLESKRQAAEQSQNKSKSKSKSPSSNAAASQGIKAESTTPSTDATNSKQGESMQSASSGQAEEKTMSPQAVTAQSSRDVEDEYDNSQEGSHSSNYEASPAVSPKKSVKKRFGPMQLMKRFSRGSSSNVDNGVSPSNSKDGGGSNRSFRRSSSKASSEGGNTDTTSGYEKKTRKFF